MPTKNELLMLQSLPLDIKILKTKARIREWIDFFGEDNVYVSFSGGKDSTVLLDLVRQDYPNVKAVFVDTGLEYPEIKQFVKTYENVEILRPKMSYKDVIIKYGYPFISKEIAQTICEARKSFKTNKYSYRMDKLNGIATNKKTGQLSKYNCPKYKSLLYTNFIISDKCCNIMKKKPLHNLKHKYPFIGQLASESNLRQTQWLKNGCNSFNAKKQVSTPIGFWTEQNVLEYINLKKLPIASVYGTIQETTNNNEVCLVGCGAKLHCSGCQRTGCVFCGFGAHLDTLNGGTCRYELLRHSHPQLFDYCMRGGTYINEIWQPTSYGLGMAHVINELNKLYNRRLKNGKIKRFIDVDINKYINDKENICKKI